MSASDAGTARTEDRFIVDALGQEDRRKRSTARPSGSFGNSPTPSIQSMETPQTGSEFKFRDMTGSAPMFGSIPETDRKYSSVPLPSSGFEGPGDERVFQKDGATSDRNSQKSQEEWPSTRREFKDRLGNNGQSTEANQFESSWQSDSFKNRADTIEEDSQKRAILHELQESAPDMVRRYGLNTKNTSLQTLQYELDRYHRESQLRSQVELLEVALSFFCYSVENINSRFLNRVLAIEGWARMTCNNMGKYRGTLRKIAIKYFRRNESNEFIELGMLLLGSLAVYHFQNTHGADLRGSSAGGNGRSSHRSTRKTPSSRRHPRTVQLESDSEVDTKERQDAHDVPDDDEDDASDQLDLSEASSIESEEEDERSASRAGPGHPSEKPHISVQGMVDSLVHSIAPRANRT